MAIGDFRGISAGKNSETLSNQKYFEKIFKVFRFRYGKAVRELG